MADKIFANHAHVFPESINAEGTIGRLLKLLDACGIEQAVCFAPFAHQFNRTDITPNQWLAGELKGHDRLVGFGTIDLNREDLADQVKRAYDLGFRGLKLHPQAQDFPVIGPQALAVYQAAQELDLFLTFHTGVHAHRMRDSRVIDFDEIAHGFPTLRFSMEHVGGYHFFHEALGVLFNNTPAPWQKNRRPRIFAGFASIFTTHQNRFWHLTREQILEVIAQIGAGQCIFGLDFPYNRERETDIALTAIRSLGLSEAETDGILGGNLRRELGVR